VLSCLAVGLGLQPLGAQATGCGGRLGSARRGGLVAPRLRWLARRCARLPAAGPFDDGGLGEWREFSLTRCCST
jgi:hypothetical protein